MPVVENSNTTKPEEIGVLDLSPKPTVSSNHIIIKKDYDLEGKNLVLDEGCILDFRGGLFKNGYITGNTTGIVHEGRAVFNHVEIQGTWRVEEISTDLFEDLNYIQSLKDVLALTDATVINNVIIKDYGYNYPVKVTGINMESAPLHLKSNTNLQLDGNIQLEPTNLFQYVIVLINGCNNVTIHGKGSILGDRVKHDYSIDDAHKAWKSHEWGHGLTIANSRNVTIIGISVNNCTGDSYSIGYNSQDILLEGISANSSRRQGITINVASDVTIKNCNFLGIGQENGTAPGAAIDIEPDDMECEVRDIVIEGCSIKDCRQGVISWCYGYGNTYEVNTNNGKIKRREGRHYVNVTVTDCQIDGTDYAFSLYGWDNAEVRGCKVSNSKFFAKYPKNTLIEGNDIECETLMINWALLDNCSIINNQIKVKNQSAIRLQNSKYSNNKYVGKTRVIVQEK